MKKKIIFVLLFSSFYLQLFAEGSSFAGGFGISDEAGNLGISIEINSPSFAYDFLVLRVESQLDFLSSYRDNPDVEWDKFSTHRIGLVGRGNGNDSPVCLYGEFGGLVVLPPNSISDDSMHWGIYGYFGFEFETNVNSPVSYYLEAGTNGIFDNAELLPGKPDYYSGFSVRTGLRYYFNK